MQNNYGTGTGQGPVSPINGVLGQIPYASDLIAAVTNFDRLSESLERTNSLMGAFAKYRQGSFNKAGDEVLNFIKPLDRLNRTFATANFGVSALGVNISKQLNAGAVTADALATKIDRVRLALFALPRGALTELARGKFDEQTLIGQAAAVQVAGYAASNPEGRSIIAKSRYDVLQASASLPGDTAIHSAVLDTSVGQALRMARISNASLEEAQAFAVKSAGQIASIAAIAGADHHQTTRFAQEIFSGSLSMNSPLALVQSNPLLQQGIALTLRKYGAQNFGDIPITAQKSAVGEILGYAASDETLGQASLSLEGVQQTFKTNLRNMYDFTQVTGKRGGVDTSVYNEIKPVLIKYYSAVNNLLEYVNNSKYSPLALITEVATKMYGNFGGTGQGKGAFGDRDYNFAKTQLGFFDYLQWFEENLNRLKPEFDKSPSLLLNVVITGISKFGAGFTNAMSYFNELLQRRFDYGIGTVDIGTLLGSLLADVINSISRGLNPLGSTIRTLISNFFSALMGRLDKVAAFQLLNNIVTTKNYYEQLIGKFINFTRPGADPGKMRDRALSTALAGGGIYGLFAILRKSVLTTSGGFNTLLGVLTKGRGILSGFLTMLPLGIGQFLNSKLMGIGGPGAVARGRGIFGAVAAASAASQSRHNAISAGRLAPFLDPAQFIFGRFAPKNKVAALAAQGLNTKILGAANRVGAVSGVLEKASGVVPLLSSFGVLPGWMGNLAIGGYLGSSILSHTLKIGASSRNISGYVQNFGGGGNRNPRPLFTQLSVAASNIPLVGPAGAFIFTQIGKLQGFLGKLFSVEGLGLLLQAAPRLLGWFGLMTTFFGALYNNSSELRKAVSRWMTFFRGIFETIGLVFGQIWDRFLRPIFKILGDVLAWVLNFVADLIPFMPKYNDVEQSDKNLLGERTKEQQEQESAGRRNSTIGLPLYGSDTPQIALGFGARGYSPIGGFAATGHLPLVSAASMETIAAPINTSLIVANSSETIRTAEQEKMLQTSLIGARGAGINIPQVIFNITSQNGNPDEIANRVSEVFLTRMRQLQAAPS